MTDFGRPEPWVEEERRQRAWEIEEERWLADRPECPFCHEKIGHEDYVDLSRGDMEDGYVWHDSCLSYALKYNKLNMTLGEMIYEALAAEWGGHDR